MLRQEVRLAIMFAFLFGFASIKAEEIPEGIMPKRAVAGTGASTSTTPNQSSTQQQQQSSTQAQQSTPTTSNSPTSKNNNNGQSSKGNNNNNNGGSSSVPNSVSVTRTNAKGQTITSHVATNSIAAGGTKKTDSDVQTGSGKKHKVKVGSKTIDPNTLKHKTTVKQPLVTKHTKQEVKTSFWTSNGHVYSSVYTTEHVQAETTGFAKATIAPSLANQGGNGDNLSTNTKKIIGGVVGGIGGAIVIGGLAFVAWRLWGKKKKEGGEQLQDDFYDSPSATDSLAGSKAKRVSNQTFETEPYNNPNGAVNKASNF